MSVAGGCGWQQRPKRPGTAAWQPMAAVWRATGGATSTIGRGLRELAEAPALTAGRVRRAGGGRKPAVAADPDLMRDLKALVEPTARGDPEGPLRWTCKSLHRLADALQAQGHRISRTLVGEVLHGLGFSPQANAKTHEGLSHPDRDAQVAFIDAKVKTALAAGEPVISVDAKKKELVGDFKNGGRAWRPKGSPEAVRVHDVLIKELGRAVPYGVYDLAANAGWVGVGQDHDTAAFAGQTIRRWWQEIGRPRYPGAKSLTITADGAARTACGCGCGSGSCSGWPMRAVWPSRSIICRPAPRSGTRSSTGCSRSSARTGAPRRW